MQLKGNIEICVVDSRTGEIKQRVKKNNTIVNQALLDTLQYIPVGVANRNISISSQTEEPSPLRTTLTNIIGTGYTPSGITSPTFNATANPIFGQIQKRIDFTGVSRVFNTVGLTSSGSNSNQNNETHNVYAYVLLDTPCIQGEYDYLDIFYRIQFLNVGGQGFLPKALEDFGRAFMGLGGMDLAKLYVSPCNFPVNPYTNLYYGDDTNFYYSNGRRYGWLDRGKISSHFKFKMAASFNLDGNSVGSDLAGAGWTNNVQGWIFNMMLQGSRNDSWGVYNYSKFNTNGSPFQNLFSHSSGATVPFFDSLKLASGNGKVFLNGNWSGKFPEFYKITIDKDGAVGTSTYRWSVRKHLGFNGNTYSDRAVACPFRNPFTPAAPSMHGWRDENNDVLRYSNTQVVQYDDSGVTLLDVLDGSYKNWDATTTPVLAITQTRQCATDGNKIYVACRLTGLWVIDVVANTVTHPIGVGCYGVDVGRNNIAYALVDGGLYCSSDWNTPLPFTYAGITDGNWNKVYFLKVDPENVNDQMAFVIAVPNQANRIVWWSVATSSAVNGPQNGNIRGWSASFDVSDTGSNWASFGVGLPTYGSTALGTTDRDIPKQSINHSIYGNDNYGKISFYKNLLILDSAITNKSGVNQNLYSAITNRSFILHLDGGIIITNREMRQLFTDNAYCWQNFGWQNNQWVEGAVGAKTTHTVEQALSNGITIKFQDATQGPHFIATDFYTESVNWGTLKDNSSTIFYESAYYTKPAQFKVPLPANFTIPTTAPYQLYIPESQQPGFVTIDVDSPELNQFSINGNAIATLYTTGTTPPAINEIRLSANGLMQFNAANSGGVVTGYFAYVKD